MYNQAPEAGLASLLASRGRGGDTMLVHMAPEEVAGLQSLAFAAGGRLTLNPDTGLYEANFLKKLLPTILGFGLNFLIPGLGALGSGLLVGAGETIRTGGDLGKGLMAGLGAFGGAGLSSGLASAGAKTIGEKAIEAQISGNTALATQLGEKAAAATSNAIPGLTQSQVLGARASALGEGVKSLASPVGRTAFMGAIPGGQMGLMAGGMGIANAMTPEFQLPDASGQIDDSYYEGADYDPITGTFRQGQWRKGYPGFPGYADGGLMPRPNFNYPLSRSNKDEYGPNVDTYTGEESFADGGPIGVSPGAVGGDPRLVLEPGPVISPTLQPQQPQALPPQQSLEQYYQSLLSAPQQQAYNPAFFDYMQSLNRYVTSPVAPPPRPPAPPSPPAAPPPPPTTPPGNRPGDGNLRWDPDLGQLVNDRGDVFNPRDFNFGNFRNLASAAFRNVGGDFGPTDGRMVYDPDTGGFRQPGSQTVTTPMTEQQDIYYPYVGRQYSEETFDPSILSDYGQTPNTPTGNLTGIDQFTNPSYDFAGGTQNFDMGNAFIQPSQMGDMGGYGQQFQGFQPLSTDFGSTYQAPAMQTPMFDAAAYAPQQTDFGSMGNYGLGALGTTYQAPQFQMPSYDFSTPAFEVPTASYSAPMTTGIDSTGVSAPQLGFGNSDVLYGQTNFGQGGEQNIFGFAEGGSIQKAAAGKLVTGDGDGMSDDIRANINGDQEARLADGEFVIPADVVSHLGNGSTDAGADRLYSMMDRIRKARTGRKQQAPEIDADKYLPA